MKKKNIVIVIPAYNEEKTIGEIIKDIPKNPYINQSEFVINDGSTDNTLFNAQKKGAIVFSNKKNLGLGATFRLGLSQALNAENDIIVILDGDGQYDPYDLMRLINPIINENCDLVIGNRFTKDSYFESGLMKRITNIFISIFISKILLRLGEVYDIQCSFRAFNKKLGSFINNNIKAEYNYAQEMFILSSLYKFKIKQIPVKCQKRTYGKSRLIKNPIIHIVRLLWISLETYVKNSFKISKKVSL